METRMPNTVKLSYIFFNRQMEIDLFFLNNYCIESFFFMVRLGFFPF